MQLKVIQFIIDSSGDYLGGSPGGARRLDNLTNVYQLVAPYESTSNILANALLANGEVTTDLMTLAKDTDGEQLYGRDVVDPTDPNYATAQEWLVWEGDIGDTSFNKISKFRAGDIKVNFYKYELVEDESVLITDKGTFGSVTSTTGGDVPASGVGTLGDYYRLDIPEYDSASVGESFLYNEASYYDGNDWQRATTSMPSFNTEQRTLGVGPAVTPNTNASDESSLTLQIINVLNDHESRITTLEDNQSLGMLEADYDTELSATKSVKYARNIGEEGDSKSAEDIMNGIFPEIVTDKVTYETDVETYFNGEDMVDEYGGITRERGKNLFVGVKARTIIGDGVVVQYDGAVGVSGKIWMKIADKAEINVAPYLILGVTTTTFSANEEKDINFYGAVNELDTTNYDGNSGTSADEGKILYYDSVNGNGGMTLTKPTAPNVQVKMAIISIYSATEGQVKVRPSFGLFLSDLHDVYFNGHTFVGGEMLLYNESNSRWELTNYTDRVLDDIKDVNASTPMVGEVLQWNGVEWVNGDIVTQGAGKSITFFIEDTATIPPIAGYELLSPIPLGLVEEDDAVVLSSASTDTLISPYATEVLGRTKIEAGTWNFETYARVSSSNGTTIIKFKVYKRVTGGTETLLFESQTEEINNSVNQLYSIISVQPEFTILATDRLVIKYYGHTTSAANPTITMVHSGTENASHIDTPLQTLHNDLAGLQGGNSTERFHLSEAELTKLTGEVVEKDLSNDTTYPPIAAASVVDDELTDVYINDNGVPRKISLNEIYAGANAATGSFVASADYKSNGLGSYKAAELTYHDLILDTLGNYKVNIKTQENQQIVFVLFPVITSNTNPLQLSTDNGTIYYPVLVNGTSVYAESVSEQLIQMQFDGTNFIAKLDSGVQTSFTVDELHESTFGVLSPSEGSPEFIEGLGLSLTQPLINGDATASLVSDGSGTQFNIKVDGTFAFTNSYDGASFTFNAVTGHIYFIRIGFKDGTHVNLSNSILIQYSDGSNTSIGTGADLTTPTNFGLITATKTLLANVKFQESVGTSGTFNKDEVVGVTLFDITNTPLASHTASQLNNIISSYFEDTKSIVDLSVQSIGKNMFDKSGIIEGSYYGFTGTITADATSEYSPDYISVSPSTSYFGNQNNLFLIEYDKDKNFIIRTIVQSATFTTGANTHYLRVSQFQEGLNYLENTQLEQGTVATTYAPYNSDTISFPNTTLRSVGDIRDRIYQDNGVWKLEQNVGYDFNDILQAETTWGIRDVKTVTHTFNKDISSSLLYKIVSASNVLANISLKIGNIIFSLQTADYIFSNDIENLIGMNTDGKLWIRVNKTTYANTGDFETYLQANDVTFTYELDEAVYTDIDKDGGLIQENPTTLIQTGLSTEVTIQFNNDLIGQVETHTDNIKELQKDSDNQEVRLDDVEADIVVIKADVVDLQDGIVITPRFDGDTSDGGLTNVRAFGTLLSGLFDVDITTTVNQGTPFMVLPIGSRPDVNIQIAGLLDGSVVTILFTVSGEIINITGSMTNGETLQLSATFIQSATNTDPS